jgi:hypothetical protein
MTASSLFTLAIALISLSETVATSAPTKKPTNAPTSSPTVYVGTDKWYMKDQLCGKDCATGTEDCIGIVRDNWVTLYDTVAACCAGKLSYLDPSYCAARSGTTPVGTNKFYPDSQNGRCVEDTTGTLAENTDKLYADAATCCSTGLGWVNSDFCESRSTGESGFADKWYVDYDSMTCKNDCDASDPPSGVDADACKENEDRSVVYYDTATTCCAGKLAWIPSATCVTVSTTGAAATSTGTAKYYADYASSGKCVQDCAVDDVNEPYCGGILTNVAGVQLFDTVEACCASKFGWMDGDLCESKTTGTATNKWYVNYQDNACVQDCTAAANSPCDGSPSDSSIQLFSTAAACCTAKLGWLDSTTCESVSTTGSASTTGTNKWYADYASSGTCKMDCVVASGSPSCGGVLSNTAGVTLYDDEDACCAAKFGWQDTSVCAARANGGYSGKFYVSYQDNACLKDCAVATANPECGGNPSDLSTQMFSTGAACCAAKLGWLNQATCASLSETGAAAAVSGSEKWYVDWSISKCVKDCPTANGGSCGGLAESWESAEFTSSSACCSAKLSWKPVSDCAL